MIKIEELCEFFNHCCSKAEEITELCFQFNIQLKHLGQIVDKYLLDRNTERSKRLAELAANDAPALVQSILQDSNDSAALLRDYLPAESAIIGNASQYILI